MNSLIQEVITLPRNFIGCNHIRKEKYGVFHRCADCRYHFCYDDKKYSYPDQYKDCNHHVKDDIFGKLTCLRCGLQFGTIFSTCEHRRKKDSSITQTFTVVQIVNITSLTVIQNTVTQVNTKTVYTQTKEWSITNLYVYGVDSGLPNHPQKKKKKFQV